MADFLRFTLLLTSLTIPLGAKDYGTIGQTFPVEEEDLIDYIRKRMQMLDGNKIQNHYVRLFQEPQSVSGVQESSIYSCHYFDPTIVAKTDIKDKEGKTIIPQGTTYNPLDHFSLSQALLFFDGSQGDHIEWAKSYGDASKWILVKGKPLELEERENRPVFFDQSGTLVQKLSIRFVPCRISQEGRCLKIESIPIKEKACAR